MSIYYKNGEKIDEGTRLLISILLCYPEINTIHFDGRDGVLTFSFLLQNLLSQEDFQHFQDFYTASLNVFYQLKKIPVKTPLLHQKSCGNFTLVEISFRIHQLSQGALSLMMELISTYFQGDLLKEEVETPTSVYEKQQEIIDSMLEEFELNTVFLHLIGLRRGGRVMVFDRS